MITQLASAPRRFDRNVDLQLPMSAPAVSKHLEVLEQAGLVRRRCTGRTQVCVRWNGRPQVCVLRERPVIDAGRWIEAQTAFWSGSLDIRWPGTCPRSRWHACHA